MNRFSAIDLSRLPPPDVIRVPDFDALLGEMKDEAARMMPELAPFLALESEPATKLLRVCAYFRLLDRAAFNDGARACLLAHATGADLDNLAAFWGVGRLTVQKADATVSPPLPEIRESDADFRRRVQLSLEGHSTAGPRGAYHWHAMAADGAVRDVAVSSPSPGEVVVTILSRDGNGTPSAALLDTVYAALNDDHVRPLTDHLTVQAAGIIPFRVAATLTLYSGPDAGLVRTAALAALDDYIRDRTLGHDVTRSGLFAALHRPGVRKVTLAQPAADIVVGEAAAAWCEGVTVMTGGRDA